MDGEVEDVRIIRMKNMGPQGDRGFVVEAKQDGRWVKLLEDGTRGEAERVAAARRRVPAPPPDQSLGGPCERHAVREIVTSMANKWGRRYKRHRDEHSAYFEALAREVVERRRATVDLGIARVEVRLRRRGRWEFVAPDGSIWNQGSAGVVAVKNWCP